MATARYTVTIIPSALRSIQSLPRDLCERIRSAIDLLAENPRPHGVKALQGAERGYLRLRVGDHRIIYRVEDDRLLVLVVAVGHRREVYR
ncbi:MAG: type II toxin-antitoxin system RelE/ParE family toxin [Thermoguttaceae bacterium]